MRIIAILLIGLCTVFASFAFASQPIMFIGTKIENDQPISKTFHVGTLSQKLRNAPYAVTGKYRCENVEGKAHFEAWGVHPNGDRELLVDGPMTSIKPPEITGTSSWREFEFHFNLLDAHPESVTLEINIVMPGKGMIELSPLLLSDIGVPSGEWFSNQTGGLLGGILGTLVGIYCGTIGTLCSFLVPRGKGKCLLLGLFRGGIIIGALSLSVGIIALILGQPWHVWYTFVLIGGLMCFLMPTGLSHIKKEYAQAELRKMQAFDV